MKYIVGLILVAVTTAAAAQSESANSSVLYPAVSEPLVVVEGKKMPRLVKSKTDTTQYIRVVDSLDPNEIERIDALKPSNAMASYGEEKRSHHYHHEEKK